jgi:phage gpG-like protein
MLDNQKLEGLIKALKTNSYVRVGILGSNTQRDGSVNNATVGAAHEFGTSKLPERSFLRMPLTEKLEMELKKSGAFKRKVMEKILQSVSRKKKTTDFLKQLGVVAEKIVLEAFETGGFGKWKTSNMSRKKVHQTLVETQQLRDSVTSDVVEK